MQESYDAAVAEKRWREYWEKNKIYKFDLKKGNIFSIDTPPPTISGEIHMGHAFSYSQTDFIARFQRMRGKNVFYPFGFDNNGLPTQKLVEKEKHIIAKNIDRKEFFKICMEVSKKYEEKFK